MDKKLIYGSKFMRIFNNGFEANMKLAVALRYPVNAQMIKDVMSLYEALPSKTNAGDYETISNILEIDEGILVSMHQITFRRLKDRLKKTYSLCKEYVRLGQKYSFAKCVRDVCKFSDYSEDAINFLRGKGERSDITIVLIAIREGTPRMINTRITRDVWPENLKKIKRETLYELKTLIMFASMLNGMPISKLPNKDHAFMRRLKKKYEINNDIENALRRRNVQYQYTQTLSTLKDIVARYFYKDLTEVFITL